MKILISGGTGLIGRCLQKKLQHKKYKVVILTRSPKNKNEFRWDVENTFIDEAAFTNVTHIIHLAGAGIADKRWTIQRKKELINSRVTTTQLLLDKVKTLHIPLKGFISASGVGYYGAVTSSKIFTEKDAPSNDFLSKVCAQWEASAKQFETLNIPVTILRTGIVLAKNGGALQKMNTPLFLAPLGKGTQYMPWIHITDLCNLYIKAVEDSSFTGVFNAVAPEHQTNRLFTSLLAKTVKKPFLPIGIPSFMLKMLLGELATMLLEGSSVSSKKIIEKGFQFQCATLKEAFKNL